MPKQRFPNVPRDLLEALEEAFPDRLPLDHTISIDDIRLLQGSRKVLTLLRRHYDEQSKNILEN